MTEQIDWDRIAHHVHTITRSPSGDSRHHTYGALWSELEPAIERWVRSPSFLGRVSADEDHRREIVVRSWERLRERDYAKLRNFVERPPAGGAQLRAFLYRVVKNLGIDYLRALPEYIRGTPAAEANHVTGRWRTVVEWGPELGGTTGSADAHRTLARRLLAHLDAPGRRDQCRALVLWAQGHDMTEIAAALQLDAAATADRLVAAAKETLRRRFR